MMNDSWLLSMMTDDATGDVELKDFDSNVSHDVESGAIDMIRAAQVNC